MKGSIPGNTLRGLLYTLRPGNLFYTLLGALLLLIPATLYLGTLTDSIFLDADSPVPTYPIPWIAPSPGIFVALCVIFLFLLTKNFDNAIRIYNGHKRASFRLFSESDGDDLVQYLTGLALWAVLLNTIPFISFNLGVDAAIIYYLDRGFVLLGLVLAPAVTLCYLDNRSTGAMLALSNLGEALLEIGLTRYLLLLAIITGVATGCYYGGSYLWQHYYLAHLLNAIESYALLEDGELYQLPPDYYLYTFLMALPVTWFINYAFSAAAWYYPREEEDEEKTSPQETAVAEAPAAAESVTPPPPATQEETVVPVPEVAGAVTETGEEVEEAAAAAEMPADPDSAAGFAYMLAQADEHFKQGDIKAGLALLKPYTDAVHDPVAYFPAYQRHYALQPDGDLLRRIAQAAARGDEACYELIQPELEQINPAELLAGSIRPLAQMAARQQQYSTVLNLTRDFPENHPAHPHLVDNQYLAALAFVHTGESGKALPILAELCERYPQHERAEQIRHVIAQLHAASNGAPATEAP